MLPNAVLPPSLDHNYAQWQEREENNRTEQPPLMKKIIPAPKLRGPGEPDSPTPLHPPTPPISGKRTDVRTAKPKPRNAAVLETSVTGNHSEAVTYEMFLSRAWTQECFCTHLFSPQNEGCAEADMCFGFQAGY